MNDEKRTRPQQRITIESLAENLSSETLADIAHACIAELDRRTPDPDREADLDAEPDDRPLSVMTRFD